ncbi:MAG: shikimate kinase [Anaerolineae bacterium]|nr:shikimate kinase [Anaerolineae bacterium]
MADVKGKLRQKHCNIVLAGFMGTGKSTVGRIIAERLGWRLVDTDTIIEARAGKIIADIFAQDGEPAFRALEAVVCTDMAALCHQVIAVGGGALINPAVQATFEAHDLVVCLTCDLDVIIQRVGDDPTRPLFSVDREKLSTLLESRAAHYASLPHHVDTTELSPEAAAEEIIQLWKKMHQQRHQPNN